ncbi:Alkaline phosphatase PafA [Usitatibacter rugosus]|uniref:Alkaline phosphatase PafA n=1 Tax=Usitatibacter rugosus TaxID=2732067 RepID=A0A6M4GUA8_9PROT|nr:alkaline phosphatase family protein [Usitatibacter rugosus]QJR10074.1 Alkaline phosphatase PafA [Usitatibacter rugosus]
MKKILATLAALLLLAGCASTPAPTASKPKLVVFMAIDGFPERQLVDYRDQLAPDGFRRFLDRGTWFSDAHYGYAFTVTAAGHATMLTGAYPHQTAIIGNEWRDPVTGEMVYCTGDPTATYIGHTTKKLDGTSPKNLKVDTVGDVLRKIDPNSKVIAISGKDRGAILPAGHRGTAYMYMAQTGQFASTTYYMKEHPPWVTAFNDAKPADAYFGREWKPLLDDASYAKSLPDSQKWYPKGGALPKKMGEGSDKPGPLYYGGLLPSPFGDDLTLNFARAAIVGENLGTDDSPDIISISLSGHDYVNHAYSAESRLSHDHTLQLDRLLQSFYQDLDRMVGKDNYVLILTADHGFMPAPEVSLAAGRNAGRQSGSQAIARINAALGKQFGEGAWVKYFSASAAELDKKLIAERKVDLAAITEAARKQLEAEEGVAVAYTRAEIVSNSRAGAPFFDQMRKSWNAERSGDIQYALKPYWMMTSSTSSTTHGSPHPYDTNIPIVFYGPAWIGAGRVDTRVEEADVAPTIARLLGIPPPATAEGKPLPLTPPR